MDDESAKNPPHESRETGSHADSHNEQMPTMFLPESVDGCDQGRFIRYLHVFCWFLPSEIARLLLP